VLAQRGRSALEAVSSRRGKLEGGKPAYHGKGVLLQNRPLVLPLIGNTESDGKVLLPDEKGHASGTLKRSLVEHDGDLACTSGGRVQQTFEGERRKRNEPSSLDSTPTVFQNLLIIFSAPVARAEQSVRGVREEREGAYGSTEKRTAGRRRGQRRLS
jgi:hypothetical protein